MSRLLLIIILLFSTSNLFAYGISEPKREGPKIKGWNEYVVPKGFILYWYLVNDSGCMNKNLFYLWDYHAYAFKDKNKNIPNIDNIEEGATITLQTCKEEVALAPPQEIIPEPKEEMESIFDESRLFFGLGFLTESYLRYIETSPSASFRVDTHIHPRIGHRLIIDGANMGIFIRNKIDFKTTPSKYQGFLSVGIGSRIGLQNHFERKISTNISNYAEASLGFRLNLKDTFFIMEAGTTVNSKTPINFSVIGMKQLGETPYYLGGYFDYVWTESSMLDNYENSRRMITGGIIFSY